MSVLELSIHNFNSNPLTSVLTLWPVIESAAYFVGDQTFALEKDKSHF